MRSLIVKREQDDRRFMNQVEFLPDGSVCIADYDTKIGDRIVFRHVYFKNGEWASLPDDMHRAE